MSLKTTQVPIEPLINLLRSLSDDAKETIFEKVFIEEDTSPLTKEEEQALIKAEKELNAGETFRWPFGE